VMCSWIPDEVVIRYVDAELPWGWRITMRAGVVLSPQLRHRIRAWRIFSAKVRALDHRPLRATLRSSARSRNGIS